MNLGISHCHSTYTQFRIRALRVGGGAELIGNLFDPVRAEKHQSLPTFYPLMTMRRPKEGPGGGQDVVSVPNWCEGFVV